MVCRSILMDLAKVIKARLSKTSLKLSTLVIGLRYAIAVVEGSEGEAGGLCFVDILDSFYDPMPPSLELAQFERLLLSPYHLWRIAGVAIVNAISQYFFWNCGERSKYRVEIPCDTKSIVNHVKGKRKILVVGNMGPLVAALRNAGIDVYVVERNPLYRLRAYTDTSLKLLANDIDALIVTGATIPNDTLPTITSLLEGARPRIIVGPTAQSDPATLFAHGIDIVATTKVKNLTRAIELIERGGGRRDLSSVVEDYVVYPGKANG